MLDLPAQRLLTLNTGSSSLKAAVFDRGGEGGRLFTGDLERIGLPGGRLRFKDARQAVVRDEGHALPDHGSALETVLTWLRDRHPDLNLGAIGHRLVHGGMRHREPERVTPELIATLWGLVPLAPGHLPQALRAIEVTGRAFPNLPQVACFDTAFHRHMPPAARSYPLPRRFTEGGVIRYGFHGLSYEFVTRELRSVAPEEASGRVIIAHLGNGASMAAVRGGVGVDTTMGFTPAGGLMMGTRTGDLDPGVLLYLLADPKLDAAALDELINRRSGLLGVSGTSADMRDLLDRAPADPRADEAIDLFCYLARKQLGALAAALGGLDTLVFTGGIGQYAAPVRRRVCEGLEFIGIRLDPGRNESHGPVISQDGGRVTVRVLHTDEDLMIARHTRELLVT